MSTHRTPLASQVVVITGATSRIGLITARMAARQGATLVLAASNVTLLDRLASDIRHAGGAVMAFPVDVASRDQVATMGRAAVQRFGRIDTWINAGMALDDPADARPATVAARLFKSHYWGAVNGTAAALELMNEGGAVINLDSDASARHGVKSVTDGLRMTANGVCITLVHAAGADIHATPHRLAEAVLQAACHEQHDVVVGSLAPARPARFAMLKQCLAFTRRQLRMLDWTPAAGTPRPFP
jgi:NADP-dependent 3-hydroxy acid dehydrogenase YdfG